MTKNTNRKAGTFFHHLMQAAGERRETIGETIGWAVDLGYSAAEIDADEPEGTEFLKERGMEAGNICCHYAWPEKIDRKKMEKHIRVAERLGSRKIMAIPGFFGEGGDREREMESMLEGMRQLSALAKENGLTLTIEDFDHAMSPIATMEGMDTFLKAVPDLRVTLDTGNFIFSGEDVLAAEKRFLPKIAHVHLKDRLISRPGKGDVLECIDGRKLYPCAVGDGDIPVREVLRVLAAEGYDGYVVTEFYGSLSYAENMERSILWLKKEGWIEE